MDGKYFISPNVDLRAAFEGAALQEEMGPALYESTGQFPAMLLAPAKLRWLENNRPGPAQEGGAYSHRGGLARR